MLRDTGSAGEVLLTQWSAVLGTGLAIQEHVNQTRAIATLAEKGDDKLWAQLLGKKVVFWLPEDSRSIARCLASFLKRALPDKRPSSLRLIAPIPLYPVMSTVAKVADLVAPSAW